ncbi:MAG: SPOR domain-containing protein [Deltaproteobacteria bacterium]|nr:SPOR domain-containing protein [Deltaproteobacteria bacterium]
MSDLTKNPGNRQIIYFFLGFVIFFAFSFSLGVIVGKEIGKSRDASLDGVSKNIDMETGTGGDITEGDRETFSVEQAETIDGIGAARKADEIKKDELAHRSTDPSPIEIDKENVTAEVDDKKAKSSDIKDQKIDDTVKIDKRNKELTALPPIEPQGKYTVQVGSFLEEKAAVQILTSLKLKRYPAFVKKVVIPGYGASYRVRIGTFGTREKAYLYGENLKKLEPNIKSVYITIND